MYSLAILGMLQESFIPGAHFHVTDLTCTAVPKYSFITVLVLIPMLLPCIRDKNK